MVPSLHIVAWGRAVPWAEPRQVEQDLIISRAVVALFDDPFLRRELRFRGGTALRAVQGLGFHLDRSGRRIGRAEAERRMFAKLRKPAFMADVRPLLPAAEAATLTGEAIDAAFTLVFGELIARLPGAPWSRTPEMADRFGIAVA